MADLTRWLQRLTNPDDPRAILHRVHRSGNWIFGTDAKVLGAIPDDGRDGVPEAPRVGSALDPLDQARPASAIRVDLAALREWCGPVEIECDCNGGLTCTCPDCGFVHEEPCARCEGSGLVSVYEPIRVGRFGEHWFNRRLLRHLIEGLPDEEAWLWASGANAFLYPLVIEGEGWRALLMGLHPERAQEIEDVRELTSSLEASHG